MVSSFSPPASSVSHSSVTVSITAFLKFCLGQCLPVLRSGLRLMRAGSSATLPLWLIKRAWRSPRRHGRSTSDCCKSILERSHASEGRKCFPPGSSRQLGFSGEQRRRMKFYQSCYLSDVGATFATKSLTYRTGLLRRWTLRPCAMRHPGSLTAMSEVLREAPGHLTRAFLSRVAMPQSFPWTSGRLDRPTVIAGTRLRRSDIGQHGAGAGANRKGDGAGLTWPWPRSRRSRFPPESCRPREVGILPGVIKWVRKCTL